MGTFSATGFFHHPSAGTPVLYDKVPVLEIASDLIQRRQPGDHGAEQGLEETGGSEFAGIADDKPGLACDKIKVGQAWPRAAGGYGF